MGHECGPLDQYLAFDYMHRFTFVGLEFFHSRSLHAFLLFGFTYSSPDTGCNNDHESIHTTGVSCLKFVDQGNYAFWTILYGSCQCDYEQDEMTTPEALNKLNLLDIILASKSPRRQQLLAGLGIRFRVADHLDMEEVYPSVLKAEEIPIYLARAKAACYDADIGSNTLLITADTIVWLNNEVIGKPASSEDAIGMLLRLSGNMHEVFTGVCIKTAYSETVFHASSRVYFRNLSEEEIRYYVSHYKPLDKAGAYGVQEWIGYVGVERIEGSYFNVMGLPVQRLYCELIKLI
jgi:septum formation protein